MRLLRDPLSRVARLTYEVLPGDRVMPTLHVDASAAESFVARQLLELCKGDTGVTEVDDAFAATITVTARRGRRPRVPYDDRTRTDRTRNGSSSTRRGHGAPLVIDVGGNYDGPGTYWCPTLAAAIRVLSGACHLGPEIYVHHEGPTIGALHRPRAIPGRYDVWFPMAIKSLRVSVGAVVHSLRAENATLPNPFAWYERPDDWEMALIQSERFQKYRQTRSKMPSNQRYKAALEEYRGHVPYQIDPQWSMQLIQSWSK